MTQIKSANDYRLGYEFLGALQEALADGGFKHPEKVLDRIVEIKRELRAFAHGDSLEGVGLGFKVRRHIIQDFGMDGYTELIEFPEIFITYDEASEFFRDFLYREYHPSAYDCTGQLFTNWHKLFFRRGHWCAYHSVAFDV